MKREGEWQDVLLKVDRVESPFFQFTLFRCLAEVVVRFRLRLRGGLVVLLTYIGLELKGSGRVPFENLALDGLVYSMISLQSETKT
jgi:hypothetical protein